MEQLDSSLVSGCGIAANINSSGSGSSGGGGGSSSSSSSSSNNSSSSSSFFSDVCTAVIVFPIYRKL